MKTVTINGTAYTLGIIKTGVARKLQDAIKNSSDFNVAFLSASLIAGGMPEATPEWIDDNLDYFAVFNPLVVEALEVNGLRSPKGEDKPAEAAG